ncbi:MAG: hypothetical protein SAL07_01145 [Oscillatoria sp. PMC 1051.18]|nr:hypothetical protein [Oscillatoria sp. PMC 1050.18]MEC5028489.1 hypothetical protein [Oscillatoria sp. PMC 1051.18]
MLKSGLNSFLQELEAYCYQQAIATFLNSKGECFVVDLSRKGKVVIYGYDRYTKDLFIDRLVQGCSPAASLILRSFTAEVDEFTQLPVKELRGYVLKSAGADLTFEKLPPKVMFACQNTDAETGEPLPLEQSVRYC